MGGAARNGLNQPTAVNSVATSSDPRGNLTFDGVKGFTFDTANRLTGTGSSTLSYDPLDRMTQMVGTLGARYLYDGDEIAGVVVPTTGTTLNARFVRGPWPDELLLAYQGTDASLTNYSLQDHQNSVIAIADGTGAATATLGYDEYGQPRSGNAGRLMYTGQLWLPDFGLYHYKARAYHPGLGRFMQTDPVGYEQGMNLYAYVGLDPMNATDPSGMIQDRPCAIVCTVFGGPVPLTTPAGNQTGTYNHEGAAISLQATANAAQVYGVVRGGVDVVDAARAAPALARSLASEAPDAARTAQAAASPSASAPPPPHVVGSRANPLQGTTASAGAPANRTADLANAARNTQSAVPLARPTSGPQATVTTWRERLSEGLRSLADDFNEVFGGGGQP